MLVTMALGKVGVEHPEDSGLDRWECQPPGRPLDQALLTVVDRVQGQVAPVQERLALVGISKMTPPSHSRLAVSI